MNNFLPQKVYKAEEWRAADKGRVPLFLRSTKLGTIKNRSPQRLPRHFLHHGRHPHGRECLRSLDLRFTEVAGLSPHAGLDRTSNRGLEARASDTRPPHLGVADV